MAFCSNCGKEISGENKFCPACGNEIKTTAVAANPVNAENNNYNSEAPIELAPKKKNKKTAVIIIAALAVIGVIVGIINYFTGDAYVYKKGLDLLKSGMYEEAFEIFDSLGDYEDAKSYLPFNGKYVDIAVGDKRYYEFKNGEYTHTIPGSDGDSVYEGVYTTVGYKKATLTSDNGDDSAEYSVYQNYIYETENEDFTFDEKIDISKGYFNGETAETSSFNLNLGSGNVTSHITWEYTFEDDGTYKFRQRGYFSDPDDPFSDNNETGTYEIDGNIITVTPNDDSEPRSFLVIDGYMYRAVYVRDYDVE